MSPTCENFIRAVLKPDWKAAFLNLNGLNMDEMLRGISALDILDRNDLWAQRASYAGLVNMPRIEYAFAVVKTKKLPATAPGDLGATGQVKEARAFLAHPKPLFFANDLTGKLPAASASPGLLTDMDFTAAAALFRAEVSAVMAVARVEAGGRAGFDSGRPIIRYELHIFHRRTRGIYDATHPHLSQPSLAKGNPFHHGGQPNEWSLMHGAMILRDAAGNRRTGDAWQSASWGMFQVMGFNFSSVGWSTIDAFVADMFRSEGQQLRAFTGFVTSSRLGHSIATHNWARFASGYNGAGYAVNHYDARMASAYASIHADRVRRHLTP